ncbi:MAG: hypothetical protein IJH57_02335 [Mogibacterium sp.]|nr:hypothetical protein [Mogibacterium sp.]
MKTKRLISIFMMLAVVLTMWTPMSAVYAAGSNVTIKDSNAPSSITVGKDFSVKGKISSDTTIARVEIGVTTKGGGKWTAQKYDNKSVNTKTFDVSKANSKLKFNNLNAGSYYYRIYVHTTDTKVHTVVNKKFTVKESSSAKPKAVNCNAPTQLQKGMAYYITGKVTSSKKISKVTVGVVNKKTGKWTAQKKTFTVGAKSFSVKKADKYIKFGSLAVGNYYYKINATVGGKSYTVLKKQFSVVKPEPIEDSGLPQAAGNSVKLSNYTLPSKFKVGQKVKTVGIISSKEKIKRVEIGVVYAATNKWISYHKYDKSGINSKTFNIEKAASKISFNTLAGGTYRYRIYVHTASGVKTVLNHKFTVTPSVKPKAAIKWALKIAADDTFSYGKKPQTSKVGCYFCGTNCGPVKYRKPKGYEKTYVCMTFIHAAYAHGAKDPEMLKECKKGNNCIALENTNMTHYSCWMKVGLCKDLKVSDLQPGDLIVWYAADNNNGHISMYIGGNDIVDSTSSAGNVWGPNAIAVRKGKAQKYLNTGAKWHKKSYVMRYCKP